MNADAHQRSILHVDMDAFFASVELLRHPELVGRPVIVGGSGERGVVAAASYEARSYGVHSAMPSVRAKRLCPDAVFLNGDHQHYQDVSKRIMGIFTQWTPLVEPLSLDEAFLDVTGSERLFGDPTQLALRLRAQVLEETSLHCSIGVARNKFLAKLATSEAKPRATRGGPARGSGVFRLLAEAEVEFLAELPVARLWGVGPATLARLRPLGVTAVGDLLKVHPKLLSAAVGAGSADRLLQLAQGVDERPVQVASQPKSISHEETFAIDLADRAELRIHLVRQADGVASRLRDHALFARTVQLKVRYADFETVTRSRSLVRETHSGHEILRVAAELLESLPVDRGVRLLGVGVSSLSDAATPEQLSFDEIRFGNETRDSAWERADLVVDSIRDKFGSSMIGPASLSGHHRSVGDHQWGPELPDE